MLPGTATSKSEVWKQRLARPFPEGINTISCEILADSKDYYEIYFGIVHKQMDDNQSTVRTQLTRQES